MGELGQEFLRSSGLMQLRPPLKPAASGNEAYTVQPFQILSWHPRIVVYPNFVDAARCDHIIGMARRKLKSSDLAWRPDETADAAQVGCRGCCSCLISDPADVHQVTPLSTPLLCPQN
jgi:hypothetical protein